MNDRPGDSTTSTPIPAMTEQDAAFWLRHYRSMVEIHEREVEYAKRQVKFYEQVFRGGSPDAD